MVDNVVFWVEQLAQMEGARPKEVDRTHVTKSDLGKYEPGT